MSHPRFVARSTEELRVMRKDLAGLKARSNGPDVGHPPRALASSFGWVIEGGANTCEVCVTGVMGSCFF